MLVCFARFQARSGFLVLSTHILPEAFHSFDNFHLRSKFLGDQTIGLLR